MRWIASIALLVVAIGLTYYLVFVDRAFMNYDGARLGVQVRVATQILQRNGWTLLPESSAIHQSGCSEDERYYFIQMRSPDYTLILAADGDCNVSSIDRKRRNIEL